VLGAAAPGLRQEPARLLSDAAATRTDVFEALVERVEPKAWCALAAWLKLLNEEALTAPEGVALTELVTVQDEDHNGRRAAREALFGALWRVAARQNLVV
jgi:hypothetical protein